MDKGTKQKQSKEQRIIQIIKKVFIEFFKNLKDNPQVIEASYFKYQLKFIQDQFLKFLK
jgi:hypothetical protein